MINQQLLDYVRAQRSAGLSKDAITQALAAGGWTPNDVNEAFMAIEGVRTPPPPPSAPQQPRTIVPPPGTQPMPQLGKSPRPVVATSEFSTAPVKIKRPMRIWPLFTTVLFILLLGVGAVLVLAYLRPALVAQFIPGLFDTWLPTTMVHTEQTEKVASSTVEINPNSATTTPTNVSTSTTSTTTKK